MYNTATLLRPVGFIDVITWNKISKGLINDWNSTLACRTDVWVFVSQLQVSFMVETCLMTLMTVHVAFSLILVENFRELSLTVFNDWSNLCQSGDWITFCGIHRYWLNLHHRFLEGLNNCDWLSDDLLYENIKETRNLPLTIIYNHLIYLKSWMLIFYQSRLLKKVPVMTGSSSMWTNYSPVNLTRPQLNGKRFAFDQEKYN